MSSILKTPIYLIDPFFIDYKNDYEDKFDIRTMFYKLDSHFVIKNECYLEWKGKILIKLRDFSTELF